MTHSLEQIITRPIRVTDQTETLIDHVLTNSPNKVSQSRIIDLGPSGHDLIYFYNPWWLATCARKPKVSGSSPAASYVQR